MFIIRDANNDTQYISPEILAGALKYLGDEFHKTSKSKGWWDEPRNHGEAISLMHSELSEALEAIREDKQQDDKIPQFSGVEAELADAIIRILEYSAGNGWNVAGAVIAKSEYNKTRPHKHGGKKF